MTDDSKSDFPSLAEVIAAHRPHSRHCECDYEINSDWHWSRHVAAEWDRACRIETVEQLDALPFLSLIREVFRQSPSGTDYGGVYERRTSGWHCIAGVYAGPADNGAPTLPARLLHHPDWRDA